MHFLLISSGTLFHNAGSMKDKAFWPESVLGKGCWSLWYLFLNDELDSGAFMKTSFKKWGHWLSKYLKAIEFTYWLYLSLMDSQLIASNSYWDICDILSNCRQKWMHLFCEVWILFFSFLERLGYHAEQA